MSSITRQHDDSKLFAHWIWMLGDEPEGTDSQPDGERWATSLAPAPTSRFHVPTDAEAFDMLIEFAIEGREERTALQVKYPPVYEPASIDDNEEFMITDEDLAYQRGYACGYDGQIAKAPSELNEDESAAWREGWSEGYHTYIAAVEQDYALGHPDPDPWNEAHSPLAGHPTGG